MLLFLFDFPINSKSHALIYHIAYDCCPADWHCLHDNLKDVLLLLVNFVSGFSLELMYISLIVGITSSLTDLCGVQLLLLLP